MVSPHESDEGPRRCVICELATDNFHDAAVRSESGAHKLGVPNNNSSKEERDSHDNDARMRRGRPYRANPVAHRNSSWFLKNFFLS